MLEEIRHLAHLLATQDNAGTSDPLYTVQRRERRIGVDVKFFANGEVYAHKYDSDRELVFDDQHPEEFARFEAGEFPEGDDRFDWELIGYHDQWVFVQAFLTLEAAEQYRVNQAHNIGESRIYVESGHNNPEWKLLREFVGGSALAEIGAREQALESAERACRNLIARIDPAPPLTRPLTNEELEKLALAADEGYCTSVTPWAALELVRGYRRALTLESELAGCTRELDEARAKIDLLLQPIPADSDDPAEATKSTAHKLLQHWTANYTVEKQAHRKHVAELESELAQLRREKEELEAKNTELKQHGRSAAMDLLSFCDRAGYESAELDALREALVKP